MARDDYTKFVLPITVLLIVVVSIIIIGSLAAISPDGFEWALFDFSGVTEPESDFSGIWAFLGEGELVEVAGSALGIVLVLILALAMFKGLSRGSEKP